MTARSRMALTTLFLLLAVGAGALGLWFGKLRPEQADREASEAAARVFPESVREAARIEWSAPGRERVVLERVPGGWRLTAPLTAPAAGSEIEPLLEALAGLRRTREVLSPSEAAAAPAEMGLSPPRFLLALTLASGEVTTLAAGADNAFDDTLYVRRDDGPVVLVPGVLRYRLDRSLFDLREKRVLPLEPDRVLAVAVDHPEGGYRLTRGEDGWQMDRPLVDRADSGAVRSLLAALDGVRAIGFPGELPPEVDLSKPVLTARVTLEEGDPLTLTAGRALDGQVERLYAASSVQPGPVELQRDALERLGRSGLELRDRTVVGLDRARAHRIVLEGGAVRVVVERRPAAADGASDRWELLEPQSGPAQSWVVSSLLYTLADLRAARFAVETAPDEAALGEHGLSPPEWTVTVLDETGQPLGALLLGAPAGGSPPDRFVTSGARERISVVPEARLRSVPRDVDTLRAREAGR